MSVAGANELHAATMDVIQRYGQVQFNLGQLNMINKAGLPGDAHPVWEEVRRTARDNVDAAIATLDNTIRSMCGLEQ